MGLQLADDNAGYVITGTTILIGRSTTIELTPPDTSSGLEGIHIGHGYGSTSVGVHGTISQLVDMFENGLALLLERQTELEGVQP